MEKARERRARAERRAAPRRGSGRFAPSYGGWAGGAAIRTVRRRGRVVAVGFYQGQATGLYLGDEFHHNGVEIRSAQIGNIHPAWSMASLRAQVITLALGGRLALGGLPRVTFRVDDAADAFAAVTHPETVLQAAFTY